MPRTTEQYEILRDRKFSFIMEKAMELFAEKGYDGTSTAMIARAAGISKGLLYHYIESKEKLVREIVRVGFMKVSVFFDMNRDGRLTGDEFEYFVRQSFKVIKDNFHFYQLLVSLFVVPNLKNIIKNEYSFIFAEEGMMQILEDYFKVNFEQSEKEFAAYYAMHEGLGALMLTSFDSYNDEFANHVIEKMIELFKR